jgi:hypothetical protein
MLPRSLHPERKHGLLAARWCFDLGKRFRPFPRCSRTAKQLAGRVFPKLANLSIQWLLRSSAKQVRLQVRPPLLTQRVFRPTHPYICIALNLNGRT